MNDFAISVENLGKQYRIGKRERYHSLRDSLAESFSAPARWLRWALSPKQPSSNDSRAGETIWALNDVSFEVKRGEVVGIIGRNGAGKSTLLKVLSRITEPTTGQVKIRGRVGSLLEVGTGFHPELTGRENIFLNGAILGMKRAEIVRKFDEIVAFAEIEQFLDTAVKYYSSGMYMRLAFAVAAHLDPEILVIDEVLAVGDAEFQKKCVGKMSEVAKGGRTVLFVSHNMAAIQALCDQAMVLRAGRFIHQGEVNASIAVYQSQVSKLMVGQDCGELRLVEDLYLDRLAIEPTTPCCGDSVALTLELHSVRPMRLQHLCVLIYSVLDVRVAVLDLRPPTTTAGLVVDGAWAARCTIDPLNLVEGDYRIGLYAASGDEGRNVFDILPLSVGPRPLEPGEPIPFAPEHRGLVALEFTMTRASA